MPQKPIDFEITDPAALHRALCAEGGGRTLSAAALDIGVSYASLRAAIQRGACSGEVAGALIVKGEPFADLVRSKIAPLQL